MKINPYSTNHDVKFLKSNITNQQKNSYIPISELSGEVFFHNKNKIKTPKNFRSLYFYI